VTNHLGFKDAVLPNNSGRVGLEKESRTNFNGKLTQSCGYPGLKGAKKKNASKEAGKTKLREDPPHVAFSQGKMV